MPWEDIAEIIKAYVPEVPGYQIMLPIQSKADGQWWLFLYCPNGDKREIGTYATADEARDSYHSKVIELSLMKEWLVVMVTENNYDKWPGLTQTMHRALMRRMKEQTSTMPLEPEEDGVYFSEIAGPAGMWHGKVMQPGRFVVYTEWCDSKEAAERAYKQVQASFRINIEPGKG